jgi:hypothetical protein
MYILESSGIHSIKVLRCVVPSLSNYSGFGEWRKMVNLLLPR